MIKVELKCIYGNKQPGQIIELKDEIAQGLIKSGAAKLSIEATTPAMKELSAVKGQLTKAQNELVELRELKDTLVVNANNEKKILTAELDGAKAEIDSLKAEIDRLDK